MILFEKYTFPVNKLLTYGDCQDIPSEHNEWPDYQKLGITHEHIEQLIQMITDGELHKADSESLEVWAPTHAWRTLAQLGSEEAILPLINSFWRSEDDDWFFEEIPYVFGMIGIKAIPALSDFLFKEHNSSESYNLTCSCLREIGKMHPEVRSECISLITRKLELFNANTPELNGLIINDLIELEATDALNSIKKAYEKESVDYSIQGDYEDVEIYMGVRKTRTTPANYPGLFEGMPFFEDLVLSIDDEQNTQAILPKKKKIGRNDPCPCGSGKKYKKCCL